MSQKSNILYTGKTRTTGGRNGESRSNDNRLDIKLSRPGSDDSGTNPEQLFAAGWSACFIGAMDKAAQSLGIKLPADTSIEAEIDLGNAKETGYFLRARLNVHVPGVDRSVAQTIADLAHQICPYSKATRGNIEVAITTV